MTGKELINIIKNKNLKDVEIYIITGNSDSGELIFSEINDIKQSDSWHGNRYFLEEK